MSSIFLSNLLLLYACSVVFFPNLNDFHTIHTLFLFIIYITIISKHFSTNITKEWYRQNFTFLILYHSLVILLFFYYFIGILNLNNIPILLFSKLYSIL